MKFLSQSFLIIFFSPTLILHSNFFHYGKLGGFNFIVNNYHHRVRSWINICSVVTTEQIAFITICHVPVFRKALNHIVYKRMDFSLAVVDLRFGILTQQNDVYFNIKLSWKQHPIQLFHCWTFCDLLNVKKIYTYISPSKMKWSCDAKSIVHG